MAFSSHLLNGLSMVIGIKFVSIDADKMLSGRLTAGPSSIFSKNNVFKRLSMKLAAAGAANDIAILIGSLAEFMVVIVVPAAATAPVLEMKEMSGTLIGYCVHTDPSSNFRRKFSVASM